MGSLRSKGIKTKVFTLLIISSDDGAEGGGEAAVPEGPCVFEPWLVVGAWGSVASVAGGGLQGGGNFDDSSMSVVKVSTVHRKFVVVVKVVVVRCVRR